jgi:hypothetical protein
MLKVRYSVCDFMTAARVRVSRQSVPCPKNVPIAAHRPTVALHNSQFVRVDFKPQKELVPYVRIGEVRNPQAVDGQLQFVVESRDPPSRGSIAFGFQVIGGSQIELP